MTRNADAESHSIVWWALKNVGALLLIALMAAPLMPHVFDFSPLHFTVFKVLELPMWLSRHIGQALVLTGALSSVFHYYVLKRSNPKLAYPDELTQTVGLFTRVRHPMYASDLVMVTGFWLMAPFIISVPILIVVYVALIKQARIEDAFMAQRYPKQHAQWKERSGLLLPRF